jgi:hypothetical protein
MAAVCRFRKRPDLAGSRRVDMPVDLADNGLVTGAIVGRMCGATVV